MADDSLFPSNCKEHSLPTRQDAERWVKLIRRCGYHAELEIQKPSDREFYGVKFTYKKGDKWVTTSFGSFDGWSNWQDAFMYHPAGKANNWSWFRPSASIYIEKEIHKWIGEYKEVKD